MGTKQDGRGKTPGTRSRDGLWSGFDWLPYEADTRDLERWHEMGAGVGIKTGNGLIAIDADTMDGDCARIVRDLVEEHLGRLPVRVGRYPKALYLCRTSEPYRYTRVEFGARNDRNALTDRVEILSDGRQFVAHGIHPVTQSPYEWPREIVHFDDLPAFSAAQIDGLMSALQKALPAVAPIVREGASTDVNQEALRGALDTVRKAVEATPNTSDIFPTREAYRDYGYAIKAALPDDQLEALELYHDWCARWTDGDNDPDIVEADWRRMKPPYRRGAGWLYELAEQHSHGAFSLAEAWFDDIDTLPQVELNPFEVAAAKEAQRENTDVFPLLSIGDLFDRPPPVWLIGRHIPQKSVGFVYSEPGAGKTFITLDMALSIAHGVPTWHGDEINPGTDTPAVVYIAAEGAFDLGDRIRAWLNRRGFADNLSKSFFVLEQTVKFMSADDIAKLVRTLRGVADRIGHPVLVVVDTVSRALPGADENLQKDMTLFAEACDVVSRAFACAVIGVHHAGKSGDMRGSTVLQGAGDFVFRLTRKKGATVGELYAEKIKAAPDGWSEHYRLDTVTVSDGRSSLVVERAEMGVGPRVELTPDIAVAVLRAMDAAWLAGEPWSLAPQASVERRAVRRMVMDFGFDAAKAEELLALWQQTGVIAVETLSAKRRLIGLKVKAAPGHAVQNEDIFG
ncbi:AAA family ATPase [Aminobacter sp. BE322]|uniref:AAA family ATPase n=1 Tax=unclassified Aminobacter TaxID=2644704 RepID=UPI003D21C769